MTATIGTSTGIEASDRLEAMGAAGAISPVCPSPVRHPVMLHGWRTLTFVHWRVDPAAVQRLLPAGLTVETFDGSAWVGLVPFEMEVTVPGVPILPWVGRFPETNVRTYVTGPDGASAVWFLSLDAGRLGAVLTGRGAYRLPYFWSHLRVEHVGSVVTYRCRRRWPGPAPVRSAVAVEVGAPYGADELGDLDHWLTARWRLYSHAGDTVRYARADHPPWPLHRARLLHLDDGLVGAAGLPAEGEPLVHWSPGTTVRVSRPHRVR